MFNNENFVSARFTNNARNLVEVLYNHNGELHPFILDINDKDNPDVIRLFEMYSMDELHESTYQYVQDQQKGFELAVMSIAERDGIISKLGGEDWKTMGGAEYTSERKGEIMGNSYKDLMNGVNHKGKKFVSIPAHGKDKLIKRQCTYDYKILPVMKKLRELYNLKPRKRMPLSEMWLGITIDEASRMKDSREPRIKNRYPFLEMMMNRSDCMHFMRDAGFPIPV